MTDSQPGHVQKRRVKCGKSNCRCAVGKLHDSYYHVWIENGRRFQRYIRRKDVEAVKAACAARQVAERMERKQRSETWRQLRELRNELQRIRQLINSIDF